ncbi:MAG: hypothetical protein ACYC6G_08440 [Desulfobaccales bacterium]
MIGNIAILICSFVFICVVSFYIFKVWPDLDVIDLYIVFVLFHFGFYSFIRGLYFGKDVIFDFRNSNPLVIGIVFVHVLLTLAIIKIIYSYLPKTFVECLKLTNLVQKWTIINKYILFFMYGILIIFQFYSYYKYGIKTYITPDDFARIGKNLPYWFTAIRTVYAPLSFLVCLGLISSLLKSQGYHKYVWLILTLGFIPVVAVYGRRFLIAVIIIWVILWLVEKRQDIFSIKYLAVSILLVLVLFLSSNIYQAYRDNFQAVGQVDLAKLKNPFAAAVNFEATLNNLRARPGTWEFNFLVFDHQFSKPGMNTNGKITWEAIKGSIPRIFWPDKKFMGIDDILAGLYHVKTKEIDIGKNLYGVGQVDFGYFSLIIVPVTILIIIIIMGSLIKMTVQYPTFLWLFSGNILFFLINIEENGNEIFFMLRNVGIIFLLFCGYVLAKKIIMFYTPTMRKVSGSIGKESI